MNKGVIAFLGFSCGSVIGFFAGKKMLEQHYNQMVEEEIESVKQAFRSYRKTVSGNEEKPAHDTPDPNVKNFSARPKSERKDYRACYGSEKKVEENKEKKTRPYVISPAEFDTKGYDTVSLSYYANGIVADDMDNPMTDAEVEAAITHDALKHFGEYEDDSVFVRNDATQTDYEVLMRESEYENSKV